MDRRARREWMCTWLSIGVRDGLSYAELAERMGVSKRTLARWSTRLHKDARLRTKPDRESNAFVDLIEHGGADSGRIEVLLPDKRRIVISSASILGALTRVLTAVKEC